MAFDPPSVAENRLIQENVDMEPLITQMHADRDVSKQTYFGYSKSRYYFK